MLGQTVIPAVVIEASESECLVMSLVENIARRQHRPIDLIREIGELRKRGNSEVSIAEIIGVSPSWVNLVLTLISRGEKRLLAAVDTGLIPITLAIEISRSESDEAQRLLLDAYEKGDLRGKKLTAVRKLLEARLEANSKGVPDSRLGRKRSSKRISASQLMEIYQREAEKQRLLVKKSEFAQTRLLFVVEAMRELLSDEDFRTMLRAESLDQVPRWLELRMTGHAAD
jgi:ParB family chromosome partitioning protein